MILKEIRQELFLLDFCLHLIVIVYIHLFVLIM